eukprot:858484-Prymnesium_polylepis.1
MAELGCGVSRYWLRARTSRHRARQRRSRRTFPPRWPPPGAAAAGCRHPFGGTAIGARGAVRWRHGDRAAASRLSDAI